MFDTSAAIPSNFYDNLAFGSSSFNVSQRLWRRLERENPIHDWSNRTKIYQRSDILQLLAICPHKEE